MKKGTFLAWGMENMSSAEGALTKTDRWILDVLYATLNNIKNEKLSFSVVKAQQSTVRDR